MATPKDIAHFYRLALRLRLLETKAVERWVDSVIEAGKAARYPFCDLAEASRLTSITVDDLLAQVTGESEPYLSGRMVLALIRHCLLDGRLDHESAIHFVVEICTTAPLSDEEWQQADRLDDLLTLATHGTFGTLADAHNEVVAFLDKYSKFELEIPAMA